MSDSFMIMFDVLIIIFLCVGIVMFLIGRADEFMSFVRGKNAGPSPYDPEKEKKATFVLFNFLLLCEIAIIIGSKYWTMAAMIGLIGAVASLVFYVIYLKKFAQK